MWKAPAQENTFIIYVALHPSLVVFALIDIARYPSTIVSGSASTVLKFRYNFLLFFRTARRVDALAPRLLGCWQECAAR